jgi:sugar/nucleoside kinase (ribokinase family)
VGDFDFDVVVIGDVNPDLIVQAPSPAPVFGQVETLVPSARLVVGGSGSIFACGTARLGLRTAMVGMVGQDLLGGFMLDALTSRGVDTTGVVRSPTVDTGVSVILDREVDRAILTSVGTIAALTAADIPGEVLDRARHLHVASYFLQTGLQPDLPGVLQDFRARGGTVSLDTNWDPSDSWDAGVRDLLAHVDLLLPNEAEAMALSGTNTLEGALGILSRLVPRVVVKRGAAGATGVIDAVRVDSAGIDIVVADTSGAGDSFDAGYVFAFLNQLGPEECLRFATACGSLSTTASGGTEAQATLRDALAHLPLADQTAILRNVGDVRPNPV